MSASRRTVSRVTSFSKSGALAFIDGRSAEARYLRRVRKELIAHVGNPSAVQMALIERAARLSLLLEKFDERLTRGEELSERDYQRYQSWNNSLNRMLKALGLKAHGGQRGPSLEEAIAEGRAARERGAFAA